MAFDLNRFKQINSKHKSAVYGYLKTIQTLFPSDNPYYNIHDLIKQTCTLFYASIHEWDKDLIGSRVVYIEETNSIKQIESSKSSSSYLRDVFDSGIHDWKFKIDKVTTEPFWYCTLGIYKTKTEDSTGYGYAYTVAKTTDKDDGEANSYNPGNDYGIKGIHCEMEKLQLSFSVNGVDQGTAFKNIEKTKYKAALNLYI